MDFFGLAVGISGNTVVATARVNDGGTGAAYVFTSSRPGAGLDILEATKGSVDFIVFVYAASTSPAVTA